jgi:hypothetical protein
LLTCVIGRWGKKHQVYRQEEAIVVSALCGFDAKLQMPSPSHHQSTWRERLALRVDGSFFLHNTNIGVARLTTYS